jgi:hypothetical protein
MKKQVCGVCLEPEIVKTLEANAKANERTVSSEIRFLIKQVYRNTEVEK